MCALEEPMSPPERSKKHSHPIYHEQPQICRGILHYAHIPAAVDYWEVKIPRNKYTRISLEERK